jgi:hypothetical protein
MANTFTKITHINLNGSTGVAITGIPATFTDLKLICNLRTSYGGPDAITLDLNGTFATAGRLSFNFDPSVNVGNGAVAYIGATNNTFTSGMWANHEIIIPNYTSSMYKNVIMNGVTPNAAATAYRILESLMFPTTSAVSTIGMGTGSSGLPYLVGSYVTLYGIKNTA